jgi:glycosyltransferase involved in cell wall biosynthesis
VVYPREGSVSHTPLVSVIVPCYNHAKYLAEALRSVGTPDALTEIVVVDDGSIDATPEVIATLDTPNPLRSFRQRHAGLVAARNRGLRESRGQYVVFLDADDRLSAGAIDLGVAKLQEHSDCAFVFGRCHMMDRDGIPLDTATPPRILRDHYRELLRRKYIWMPAMVMFRRRALDRVGGFNPAFSVAADYEMYLHLARHYPVHDHAQMVAYYRQHEASPSGRTARMLGETLAVMRSQLPFLEGDTASLAALEEGWRGWQAFYGRHLAIEVRMAMRSQRWAEAAVKAAVLAWYHPRYLLNQARRKRERAVARSHPCDQGNYADRAVPATGMGPRRSTRSG